MHKLKSEKHIHLTDNVLRVLTQNRITTVFEFLHEDTGKLTNLTKLSLSQILTIRNDILKKYSAPLVNGASMYFNSLTSQRFMSTGIPSLDSILDGGLLIGFITEICGLTDSGKTQLCLQLAINSVKSTDKVILYIDTKGDFSAVKIQKILDACGLSHKEMASIMFKIRVTHIWTMDEIVQLFRKLQTKDIVIENLGMIIIDSLPCLMFQYLGDENKVGLTFLNTMINYSRHICKEFKISIVCVNIQTRWVDHSDLEDDVESLTIFSKEQTYSEKRNRCLGNYWQNIPATVLVLEKMHGSPYNHFTSISIKVIKAVNVYKIQQCIVRISGVGVSECNEKTNNKVSC